MDEQTDILDLFRLDGRVAVVTGASSGLGAGFARALAQAGADVLLAARRVDRLSETLDAVRATGRRGLAVPTDVTDPQQCARLARTSVDELGRVDVLVNNAGISAVVPALQEDPQSFRDVVDVNLMGAYWAAQECARVMEPGSSIVNVASVLGLIGSALPQAAYSASKAGLLGLTRDLAAQWTRRRGIRVNAVAPGFVATEMTAEMSQDVLERFVGSSPIPRLATQAEIDAAVLFLAAPASSYMSGSTLTVDGGMSGH